MCKCTHMSSSDNKLYVSTYVQTGKVEHIDIHRKYYL